MQERLLVYQRAGEPCRRCGRPVRRIVVGGRATHFCSWCQRLPRGDRKGAATILRGMTPRPGRRPGRKGRNWKDLDGADALGRTPGEIEALAARARARADADAPGGRDPTGAAATRGDRARRPAER